jgi:Mn-containing catalase
MAKAANSVELQQLFENHLLETKAQVERLNECFSLMEATAKAKPCKGMMGLVEEGEEIMAEGKEKDEVAADLTLIGAAQKVEHYEISAYMTAKTLAQQLRIPAVVHLLNLSLAEEQNSEQLLTQLAQPLMSAARVANVE